eukprot:1159863-Pelagomonas_calceolata.AAC.2
MLAAACCSSRPPGICKIRTATTPPACCLRSSLLASTHKGRNKSSEGHSQTLNREKRRPDAVTHVQVCAGPGAGMGSDPGKPWQEEEEEGKEALQCWEWLKTQWPGARKAFYLRLLPRAQNCQLCRFLGCFYRSLKFTDHE